LLKHRHSLLGGSPAPPRDARYAGGAGRSDGVSGLRRACRHGSGGCPRLGEAADGIVSQGRQVSLSGKFFQQVCSCRFGRTGGNGRIARHGGVIARRLRVMRRPRLVRRCVLAALEHRERAGVQPGAMAARQRLLDYLPGDLVPEPHFVGRRGERGRRAPARLVRPRPARLNPPVTSR
jgi:hypothetical protein